MFRSDAAPLPVVVLCVLCCQLEGTAGAVDAGAFSQALQRLANDDLGVEAYQVSSTSRTVT